LTPVTWPFGIELGRDRKIRKIICLAAKGRELRAEVGCRRSEIGGQKSEIRASVGQRSEVGDQGLRME